MTEQKAFSSHAEIMEYLLVKIEGKYVNKVKHASGAIVGYDRQGSLYQDGILDILNYAFSIPSNWSPYIEPNKPKWYEVAEPGEVLFWAWNSEARPANACTAIFKFYAEAGAFPFKTMAGTAARHGEPLTPEEVQKYLDAAIRVAEATK